MIFLGTPLIFHIYLSLPQGNVNSFKQSLVKSESNKLLANAIPPLPHRFPVSKLSNLMVDFPYPFSEFTFMEVFIYKMLQIWRVFHIYFSNPPKKCWIKLAMLSPLISHIPFSDGKSHQSWVSWWILKINPIHSLLIPMKSPLISSIFVGVSHLRCHQSWFISPQKIKDCPIFSIFYGFSSKIAG